MVPLVPVVIVPVLTEHHRVDAMLDSFDGRIGDLVVIDNGNNSYWEPRTEKAKRVFHYRIPCNLGVAASWNMGIKATCSASGWLVVNHDVVFGTKAVEDIFLQASYSNLVLSGKPPWSCFWLGSQVVRKVGLFHEGFHPAYFEDDDFARRVEAAGLPIRRPGIPVRHDNSSTIQVPKYGERNAHTFVKNSDYYAAKAFRGDMSEGRWSLRRRRELSWD